MSHDIEFPSGWDNMSQKERSLWMAKWFDLNVDLHQKVGKMKRAEAERFRKKYRDNNGRGKRRK